MNRRIDQAQDERPRNAGRSAAKRGLVYLCEYAFTIARLEVYRKLFGR
jgi:hypothetical protein